MPEHAVGVVGLGGLGSAAAYWLARDGVDVVGFEQFELGHVRGASHDHSRIIRRSYHTPGYVALTEEAYTAWEHVERDADTELVTRTGGIDLFPPAAAIDPEPQWTSSILAVVLFLWTPPHFWSLAAAKADDYAAAGVPMLPVVAPEREWTLAILIYTATLAALSLTPLWFGMGWIYGLFAAAGGGWFLWKSWLLYRAPSRKAAMSSFLASLIQLTLLVTGIFLTAWLG